MLTAILPSMTQAEAIELTGSDDVSRLLEYLYRRHLFVDRRRGAPTIYRYHALFREFLLEEGRRRLPAATRRELSSRAARLLEARGEADDALVLYREAADWEAMRRLIRANALEWARHGRAQALSDWIEALPPPVRGADPWLDYWFGRAWIFVQAAAGTSGARARLRRVPRGRRPPRPGARAQHDRHRLLLRVGQLRAHRSLAARVRAPAQAASLRCDWPRDELRAQSAYVIALLFRRPDHPDLDRCARRLDEFLDDEPDVNVRMMAASMLLNYLNWYAKGTAADGLVARIEPLLAQPDVTPLMQVWWRTHLSFWHFLNGRYDQSAGGDGRGARHRRALRPRGVPVRDRPRGAPR